MASPARTEPDSIPKLWARVSIPITEPNALSFSPQITARAIKGGIERPPHSPKNEMDISIDQNPSAKIREKSEIQTIIPPAIIIFL